jgi:hypothetical protein
MFDIYCIKVKSEKIEEVWQEIKSFLKWTKDMDREISKLKSHLEILDRISRVNKLQAIYSRFRLVAHQLHEDAQALGGVTPVDLKHVSDMTEEENEMSEMHNSSVDNCLLCPIIA